MNYRLLRCLLTFFIVITSCTNKNVLDELEHVKTVGNDNPQRALTMLDSLELEVRDCDEYTKAKYDLLKIRLNDKADILPNSDLAIKKLVEYFGEKGSNLEKQEVMYYAGSVYRDLQDTPRAMEYFLMSTEYATDNNRYDTVMLRNTYSNLNYLYFIVQDYRNAAIMARKELDISKKNGMDDIISYMHLGASFMAVDSLRQAESAFDTAFAHIVSSKSASRHQSALVNLLCSYSQLDKTQKASKCLPMINADPLTTFDAFSCLAFAQYYVSIGKNDSTVIYCKRILDDGTDMNNMYDAAKILYRIYNKVDDSHNAANYAELYMQLSDSIDFGKRQELAATVNNEFQYHLDRKKEQELKDGKERYRNTLIIVSLMSLLLLSLGYTIYVWRKNKHMKEVIALSAELQRINAELSENETALKEKEQLLSKKISQNKAFLDLLHQSELEGKAEDVINAIRKSSVGRKNMKSADWKRLCSAVDQLYPDFKDQLLNEQGTFTEQQMRVCYLMKIGLSNTQIQNMTDLSRTTVWRLVKKYSWVR